MPHGPLIDTHQHPVPDYYIRAMAAVGISGSGENPWPEWSVERQLDLMDEMGIAATVQSVASPGCYFGDPEQAHSIARECNEGAAKMVADRPHRFGAFALLPLPDVERAAREAQYALDTLKLDGICLLTHAGPYYLGRPEEDELYAELDRRNAVVFLHPLRNQTQNMPAYSYPAGMTELVFDTTRAVHNMLWNGTFARFRNIRWIMPHGAGTAPFLAHRLRQLDYKRPDKLIGGTVAATLRALYYDVAAICDPAPLRALMEVTDPGRILFGSDYPFSRQRNPAQDVRDTIAGLEAFQGWDAAVRRGIESGNALTLFPRFAAAMGKTRG